MKRKNKVKIRTNVNKYYFLSEFIEYQQSKIRNLKKKKDIPGDNKVTHYLE